MPPRLKACIQRLTHYCRSANYLAGCMKDMPDHSTSSNRGVACNRSKRKKADLEQTARSVKAMTPGLEQNRTGPIVIQPIEREKTFNAVTILLYIVSEYFRSCCCNPGRSIKYTHHLPHSHAVAEHSITRKALPNQSRWSLRDTLKADTLLSLQAKVQVADSSWVGRQTNSAFHWAKPSD